MKRNILCCAASLALLLWGFSASASNMLANGSFENGLTGWTTSGTQIGYLPSVIVTNGVTGSAFGEAVPADTVVGGSPDAAGTHGLYFVDDRANQLLTQSVFLDVGHYEIGFDAYAPQNGFNNPVDAAFTGTIAGVSLASYTVHTQNTPRQWIHYAGVANIASAGFYDAAFNFQSFGSPAADVVIDRVYIAATDAKGGTDIPPPSTVPEPGTLALLGTGLVGLAGRLRRFKR